MTIFSGSPGFDIEHFLRRPLFAHLATHSNGGARNSPVWFQWEDGAFWIIGDAAQNTFGKRIASDPRCSLGMVYFVPIDGTVQHVGVRGNARVQPFDAQRAKRLLSRYLGEDMLKWDERFTASLNEPSASAFLVRLDPETIVMRDQSYRNGRE